MEWIALSSGVIGAIFGGLITGIFSLKSTDKAFKYQRVQKEEHEKKL